MLHLLAEEMPEVSYAVSVNTFFDRFRGEGVISYQKTTQHYARILDLKGSEDMGVLRAKFKKSQFDKEAQGKINKHPNNEKGRNYTAFPFSCAS